MREILFRNMTSVPKRRKAILISERSEDKECKTYVRKSFVYIVTPEVRVEQPIPQPDIYIRKSYSTKTKEEKFSFRVKGYFYVAKEGFSDQMFLIKVADFRALIYSEIRFDAAHFPRGDVFEKRVFSFSLVFFVTTVSHLIPSDLDFHIE